MQGSQCRGKYFGFEGWAYEGWALKLQTIVVDLPLKQFPSSLWVHSWGIKSASATVPSILDVYPKLGRKPFCLPGIWMLPK